MAKKAKKTKNESNVVNITTAERTRDDLFWNAMSTLKRMAGGLFGQSPDGKRNYNALYGYGEALSYADYYSIFRRGGIANTVVAKIAKSCWRDVPELMVNEEPVLEDEIEELKKLGLFKALERADILNRIGRFSVLLVGIPDGLELNQPLGKANNLNGVYFNPYSEDGTNISAWDTDPASARYGLPLMYQLQTTQYDDTTKAIATSIRTVHYSRVIHMAEGALDNAFEGLSALEPCWNALIDKEKARGGSGEAYFRNARQKFSLEAMKDTQIDKSGDGLTALRDEVEAFSNDQQDFMRLQNMTAKVMQPAMASPRDTFDIAVEEISGVTGIPLRAFGRASGQYAANEDKATFNAVINDRQESECSGYLERGLEIFSQAGLVELPEDAVIEWPVQPVLNETEDAKATDMRASAANKVADVIVKLGEDATPQEVLEAVGFKEVSIKTEEIEDDDVDPELPPIIDPEEGDQ